MILTVQPSIPTPTAFPFSPTEVVLIAAGVAALASLIVAIINAVAARLQARAVARREYRFKTLQSVLTFVSQETGRHRRIAARNVEEDPPEVPYPDLGGLGLVSRTKNLKEAWDAFRTENETCHRMLGEIDRERAARRSLAEARDNYKAAITRLEDAAITLSAAIEKFVF